MTDSFDISLKFILDEAAQKRVEAGASTLAEELAKVGVSMDQIKGAKFGDAVAKEVDKAAKSTKEKLNPALKETKDLIKEAKAEAALLQKQAAAMSSDLEKQRIASLRGAAGFIEGIGRGALIGGTAVSGGIFLAAKNYIKDAEESDELTRQWLASTKEIEKAQERIGRVAAQAVLPTLEKAAEIAGKVAGFVEAHPEIVEAAFNTGLFVAGFGALSIAVSKGIKLFADVKYLLTIPVQLEAAKLQDRAATKQLEAAALRLKELGVSIPTAVSPAAGAGGVGGLLAGGTLATIITTLVAPAVGAIVGDKIFDAIEGRDVKFNDYITTAKQALALDAKNIGDLIGRSKTVVGGVLTDKQFDPNLGTKWFEKVAIALGLLENKGEDAAKSLENVAANLDQVAGSLHESEIVAAFEKWKEDDARIVSEAAAERIKIVAAAEKAVSMETARNAARVSSINAAAAKRAESLTSNFLRADTKAEADYQEQRAKIIRDGGKEVRRIEDDHQERLRKLTLEHKERVEDLTASRDALGLAKEARRFNQAKAEEARSTREEIAKRREDIAVRLQEIDREHQIEQAQRLAQFQEAIQENEAQRKEELKQAAIAHAEEMKQIREQRAAQLRELAETLTAERLRRREVFIEQIRDLDASLLGERGLKQRYYTLMLQDAEKWLAAYRAKLAAGSATAPTHDYTGYAYSGLYRMAANGQPEYVLSGGATRAAEKIIGGRLTQDALLTAMVRGASQGGSRTVTLNDQRRINASVPLSERRALVRDTVEAIKQELRR